MAFNPPTAGQAAALRSSLEQHDILAYEDLILSMAQNAIVFGAAPEEQTSVTGGTRFGGLPDVPPGWAWPENVSFIGQINLAEVAPYDVNGVLPAQGLLRFFLNDRDFESDGLPHRVEFFDGDFATLQRARAPRGYLPHSLGGEEHVLYRALPVLPSHEVSLPSMYTHYWSALYKVAGDDATDVHDAYSEVRQDLKPHVGEHQLLGHHGFVDGDAASEDWVLLLQVDSDDRIGTQFNDAGIAFFMIRPEDLAARRFDRTFASFWSS